MQTKANNLSVGSRIVHPEYGEGEIVGEHFTNSHYLIIAFDSLIDAGDMGLKTVHAKELIEKAIPDNDK